MNINRIELLNAVKAAQRFTGRKVPVTQNVLLKAEDGVLSVIGTDLNAAFGRISLQRMYPLICCGFSRRVLANPFRNQGRRYRIVGR